MERWKICLEIRLLLPLCTFEEGRPEVHLRPRMLWLAAEVGIAMLDSTFLEDVHPSSTWCEGPDHGSRER